MKTENRRKQLAWRCPKAPSKIVSFPKYLKRGKEAEAHFDTLADTISVEAIARSHIYNLCKAAWGWYQVDKERV